MGNEDAPASDEIPLKNGIYRGDTTEIDDPNGGTTNVIGDKKPRLGLFYLALFSSRSHMEKAASSTLTCICRRKMSRITLATGSLARNPATEGCSGGLATGTYEHPKFQGI